MTYISTAFSQFPNIADSEYGYIYIREHSADIRSYSFAAPKYKEPRK